MAPDTATAYRNSSTKKDTHFLLELIQNADDNSHDCGNPTLSFTYKPGCLRIDVMKSALTPAMSLPYVVLVKALRATRLAMESLSARRA